jgi:hypothetical protein
VIGAQILNTPSLRCRSLGLLPKRRLLGGNRQLIGIQNQKHHVDLPCSALHTRT